MVNFVRFFFMLMVFLGTASAKSTVNTNSNYTVVPLIFKSWLPSVLVTIQGIQIPLQVDLGAAKTELSLNPAILKKFKIVVKYTGKVRQISDAQGKKVALKEFILPAAQLSDLKIKNINGIETHPFPWGGPGNSPADDKNGVIGLGLMAKFNIIIDYKNAKLILIKGNNYLRRYDVNEWKQFPFVMDGNIITQSTLGNKKVSLLWDTGSQFNLVKSPTRIIGKMKNCTKNSADALGTNTKNCRGVMTTLRINNHYFKNVTFYIYPMKGLPADGIVGSTFFQSHIVYINFSKHRIAVRVSRLH